MFERLAGKFLSRLLSKYFISDESSTATSSSSTGSNSSSNSWNNLGVWSGYVSLEHLELKKNVINDYFKSKGIPLELLSCTIKRVEITIPWAKLHNPNEVVVVVLDGVHALFRVHLHHDDGALRHRIIQDRRQALVDSEVFGKDSESYMDFIKRRATKGMLKDMLDKLHVHIRNVHIRVEDIQSHVPSPFAVGLTLESLHIHHNNSQESNEGKHVVRKVAQLNHVAIYWNALEYGHGIPTEWSALQRLHHPLEISLAMDNCIARRASPLASPSRNLHAPKHVYLLLPVDATAHLALSTTPNDLTVRPILVVILDIDDLSMQLRDFQLLQIQMVMSSLQDYTFAKQYRPYRPSLSATKDPKAWWDYAVRIIRTELQRSRMRWSWSRFHQRYTQRRRYCELYERQRRHPVPKVDSVSINTIQSMTVLNHPVLNGAETNGISKNPVTPHQPLLDETSNYELERPKRNGNIEQILTNHILVEDTETVEQCHDSADSLNLLPLTMHDADELAEIEDGVRGDLTVHDIVLYRALIKARLANNAVSEHGAPTKRKSRLRRLMSSVITDEIESEEEYEHLLAYLEQSSKATDSQNEDVPLKSLVAMSLEVNLGHGCITLWSPLSSTADLNQNRRIQERFLDMSIDGFHLGYILLGNFEAFQLQSTLDTLSIKEIRSNMKEYVVVSRIIEGKKEEDMISSNASGGKHLVLVELISDPPEHPEYDIGVHAQIDAILISLSSSCEWIHRMQHLIGISFSTKSKKSFWEGLSFASSSPSFTSRTEILAKIEAATSTHKNLDLDIQVKMPTISIDDSDDKAILIDLGEASIVTDRLAGVSTGNLNYSTLRHNRRKYSMDENEKNRASTPVQDDMSGSFSESQSPRMTPRMDGLSLKLGSSPRSRGLDTFVLGRSSNSIISVDDRRPFGRSNMSIHENVYVCTTEQADDMTNVSIVSNFQSSFYDVFNLRLSKPRISLKHDSENDHSDLLNQLEVVVVFEVSVLPTDHTLCRLIANCTIEDVGISCSTTDIDHILSIFRSWRSTLSLAHLDTPLPEYADLKRDFGNNFSYISDSNSIKGTLETASDSSSILNEAEFIDALDGVESEGNNDWFDENFVVDTESTVASESQSIPLVTRRRRSRSISDTSTISELSNFQPQRKLHRNDGAYLSAENLAKLDENGGEDHSDDDSEDSFHSAVVSLHDRQELLEAISNDIDRVSDQVWKLKRKLSDCSVIPVLKLAQNLTSVVSSKRRDLRKSIKFDLGRAEADLKALHASRQDLLNALPDPSVLESPHDDATMSPQTPRRQQEKDRMIERANSVLRSRRKRVSIMESDGFVHSMTNKINREKFRGSFQVQRVSFLLSELSSLVDQNVSLETTLSKMLIGTTLKSNDIKLFASVDSVQVMTWICSFSERNLVLAGGDDYTLAHSMLPSEFPQLISSSTNDEKFMRFARHIKRNSSGGKFSKIRLLVGSMEVAPRSDVTSALLGLKSKFASPKRKSNMNLDAPWKNLCDIVLGKTAPQMQAHGADFITRISSIRIRFLQGNDSVGALIASEVGVKFARSMKHTSLSSRCQIDLRCSNLQVLEIKSIDPANAVEILGRREPYGNLFYVRLRAQTVPSELAGGWVVGGQDESGSCPPNYVNCHVGIRFNAFQVVASVAAIGAIVTSISLWGHSPINDCSKRMESNVSHTIDEIVSSDKHHFTASVRWRLDFSVTNIAIIVPGKTYHHLVFPSIADSCVLLGLSLQACAQRDSNQANSLHVQLTAKDVHITRTTDDWPILEKTELCALFFVPNILHGHAIAPFQLVLPQESTWAYEECGFFHQGGNSDDIQGVRMLIYSHPLRINLSSQICGLLVANFEPMKMGKGQSDNEASLGNKVTLSEFDGHLKLEFVEARLLRQSQNSSSIALADRVASAQFKSCSLSAKLQIHQSVAYLNVREAVVCDLSSLPGVYIVGSSPLGDEGKIDFLRFNFASSRVIPGPNVLQVNLIWGDVQIIPIPTFIKSLIQFKAELDSLLGPKRPQNSNRDNLFTIFARDTFIVLTFEVQYFECILSSRSILAHLRDKSNEPVNVVSFRWTSSTKGFVVVKHALSEGSVTLPAISLVDMDLLAKAVHDFETLSDFGQRCLHIFTVPFTAVPSSTPDQSTLDEWQAFTVRLNLEVTGFQALRTTIQQDHDATTKSEKGTPHKFMVQPPIYGEQRITNQIDFRTRYRLSGTRMLSSRTDLSSTSTDRGLIRVAQAAHFDAACVDVLVYIRQSTGGLNDAYRVTIEPIQVLFMSNNEGSNVKCQTNTPGLADFLYKATTVFSAKLDGFQVTCVPGGATRLTESPIIKAALSNLHVSLVLLCVPRLIENTTYVESSKVGLVRMIEDSGPSSFTACGWISGELSAHYHNRRLVAWEPVVEPWTVHGQFGADLNRLFGQHISRSIWQIENKSLTSTERLRDIGRRWVSKFSLDTKVSSMVNASSTGSHMSDLPYILLTSLGWDIVSRALHPSIPDNVKQSKRILPPASSPREWLELFGLPSPPETDNTAPILCSVSDTNPLNINVTGALLENLSTYLGLAGTESSRSTVPHWIRNETGLTIRFQEVLDLARQRIGERTTKTILRSGHEIPLSLKRTLSQSCDPHRATIQIEIGKYDETYSQITGIQIEDTAEAHQNIYCYRTTIAVDTVGVNKIPLLPNSKVVFTEKAAIHCSKLYIIARVSLKGDNKVVSLESPLLIKNSAEVSLGLKITGSSLFWTSGLEPSNQSINGLKTTSVVPVPADILPIIDARAASLTVSRVSENGIPCLVRIPPTYSENSLTKGKISEDEVCLKDQSQETRPPFNLNVCGLRIGSVDLNSDFASDVKTSKPKQGSDPQQRMILFRPIVVIHNHLPVSFVVWIRPKRVDQSVSKGNNLLSAFSSRDKMLLDKQVADNYSDNDMWFNLGIVQSGGSMPWSGAPSDERIELRVRLVENDGEEYRQFPGDSTIATIVPTSELLLSGSFTSITKLRIADASHSFLSLTTTVEASNNLDIDATLARDLESFVFKLTSAPREVSISVPFWLVDSSGLELEYALCTSLMSNYLIAGQRGPLDSAKGMKPVASPKSLGLAGLLENDDPTRLASASPLMVLMIGDKAKPKLKIRRRPQHSYDEENGEASQWSRPIELGNTYSEINLKALTLRSQTVSAPSRFGGKIGTKIIHIFSKIEIISQLGRDIELVVCRGKESPTLVKGDGQSTPFHCRKEGRIKFRPTEFGWKWSGSLELREERKDVTLRLVHKLRGQVILVTVDFFIGMKSVGDRVIFRVASHPPFRIENHTIHALRFFQGYSADKGTSIHESTLLAFQSVDFAWDEPDADSTSNEHDSPSLLLTLEVVDLQFSAEESEAFSRVLGRLELENIAPSTEVHFSRFSHLPSVAGKVVADGPTKVLHIIDTSLPILEGDDATDTTEAELGAFIYVETATSVPCWITVRMNHGIGVSFVDWIPQELVYVRFDDIRFDRSISFTQESFAFSIGRISIDNQLWVTPYPVLLQIDKRTGRRVYHAFSLSCRRALKEQGGLVMVDKLEMSVEPISLQVDGSLVELLERAYHVAASTILKVGINESTDILSLEDEIGLLLNLRRPTRKRKESKPYVSVLAENFVESGAWAMKSRGKIRLGSSTHYRVMDTPEGKVVTTQKTPKTRRRAYINRTDVSALKAEFSWAGPLPLPKNLSNLSRSMLSSVRSVLTFESIPVSVGAFSREHTFSDDISDALRHHYKSYLSPGAILGILAGLPFRAPASVMKAIFYTANEFFAEFLDSLAEWNGRRELSCLRMTPREILPSHASKELTECIVGASWPYNFTVGRVSLAISKIFHLWTSVFATWASRHRYAGIRKAGDQLATRRRNPRLFAHINGQDLLVDYVEGASAGKALLSRVRRGQHLGEGYVYHTENAIIGAQDFKSSQKALPDNSKSLILMVSIERILVLNSDRGVNFCDVLWEVTFSNIVHVEVQEREKPTFDMIKIWYLNDTAHSTGNREDLQARFANVVTADISYGLAALCCKTLFVPHGNQWHSRMSSFHDSLVREDIV